MSGSLRPGDEIDTVCTYCRAVTAQVVDENELTGEWSLFCIDCLERRYVRDLP